jgi:pimeloyl-ACP methyl ester carboxylesterase
MTFAAHHSPGTRRRLGGAIILLLLGLPSCKSNASTPLPPPVACDADAAAYDSDPGSLAGTTGGQVLRCGHDGSLDASEIDQLARSAGYTGATLGSGASIIRLSYRTERGTQPPTPGFGAAVVLLPDHPRATSLPVIVVAHGTVGEGPACPISLDPVDGANTYLAELAYPLVGGGYAVIVPDYAGYAAFGETGNPPSGYHSAADEGMSVLDAARALRAVQPALFTGDTVLVGHSQGGHAVLSALAMHATYGSGGNLAAVVAYAPSWFSMASFGALLEDPNDYPLATNADTIAASVWYHYSHAELLDGPGAGALLFAAAKRAQITQFFDQTCDPNEQVLATMGTLPTDLFDPAFVSSVAFSAALNTGCNDDVCTTWLARYAADRPHITGDATSVPILVAYGDSDEWIPADREVCGFDRLASDGANSTVCIVAGADHDGVVGARAQYVNEWIGSLTLGGTAPGTCGPGAQALENPEDAGGGAVTCAIPPTND